MKLNELVKQFRNGQTFKEFCHTQLLNHNTEVIEVYMMKPFNLNNELIFFEIEETGGVIEYLFNGNRYYNLFDFYYFQDFIDESKEGNNLLLNDEEIALRLYNYVMKDA